MTMKNNKVTGDYTNNIQAFLANKVQTITIKTANWARVLKLAEQGRTDAIYPAMHNVERSEYLDYSLYKVSDVSLSLYSNIQNTTTLAQLSSQHTVAIPRDINYDKSAMKDAKIFEVVRFEQAVQMLASGRVDFIVGVTEIVDYLINQKQLSHIKNINKFGRQPVYLALAKNSEIYPTLKSCLTVFSS
nr:transporter substrate-binding domain-containing protein [Thalassotalea algicola]